ncbi:RNA polymerase sigma factor [Paeniglutamicibacter sp. NPDC091659]|uniref:RNA polymerase sigma factor n=1 Tax=Paeniglutamicibacter sp. NPDC091659 TaxID=3364389 RepID=UPI0038018BE1
MKTNPPFELVVREHGPAVLRMCTALLRPGPDAQDAWSETFLAALRAYPGLEPGANVQAWLITIARRKAIDSLRSRHPVPVDSLPETAVPIDGFGPDGWFDHAGLLDALGSLTELQRRVIGYHYLLGFPYAEIPEFLGGSAASLRRAAADGIKSLRKLLDVSEEER